jgi:hypothetical protein
MECGFYLPIPVSAVAEEVSLRLSIRIPLLLFLSCLMSGMVPRCVQASNLGNAQAAASKSQTRPHTGEEVFKTNCGRCHNPPASLPPRITGTVIMHMRTRAKLSRQDELLLLKYLAP